MKYFQKEITKIHLLDVFTPEERQQTNFQVTINLASFLKTIKNLEVKVHFPVSENEVIKALKSLRKNVTVTDGVILHILGHADRGAKGFGNNTIFYIPWINIRKKLAQINAACNDGLIINTTCVCYGQSIFKLAEGKPRPFCGSWFYQSKHITSMAAQ